VKKILILFFFFLFGFNSITYSGPFSDEFSRCIITKTTSQEKTDLVKWIYVTISFHSQLSEMSNISSKDVEIANIRVAEYMTNVFAYKCKNEMLDAVEYEGEESATQAFKLLGEIAMREIMSEQNVSFASELFIQYLDEKIFENIFAN
tara:strand:+ start:219 stop:662 length:444 start_codon:yes stop_codon:yes gene_type:complete